MKLSILLFFILFSHSEIEAIIKKPVLKENQAKADHQAQAILSSYEQSEPAMDAYMKSMDKSWYNTVSLYINSDYDEMLESIEQDTKSSWHKAKSVTISVVESEDFYCVVVWGY